MSENLPENTDTEAVRTVQKSEIPYLTIAELDAAADRIFDGNPSGLPGLEANSGDFPVYVINPETGEEQLRVITTSEEDFGTAIRGGAEKIQVIDDINERLEHEPLVEDAIEDLGEQALMLTGIESPTESQEATVAPRELSIAERMQSRLGGSMAEAEPSPVAPEKEPGAEKLLSRADIDDIIGQMRWTLDMSNGIKHNLHDAGPGSERRIRYDIQANIGNMLQTNKDRLEKGQISELAALLMNAAAVGASPDRDYAHQKPFEALESTEVINSDELTTIKRYVGSMDYLASNPSSDVDKLSLVAQMQEVARNTRQSPQASKAYGLILDALAAGFGTQVLGNESYQAAQTYINALHEEL